ncbi:MAG: hypothetical protein Q8N05_22075 [Bacteroidota bacterium]|nr:hypothetical protein [Bacteroidota bacterium]
MSNEGIENIIEKSFRTEPDFHLPADFAQKVTFSVVRREQWKTDLREYLSLTAVFVFLLAAAAGTYYLIDKTILTQIFSFVSRNVLQVVLVAFILNFILFADRVLLRLLFRSLPHPPPKEGS